MTTAQVEKRQRTISGVGKLEFVREPRGYWLTPEGGNRRTRLPSVTTILGTVIAKPGLLKWYGNNGTDGAEALMEAGQERGKAVHRFIETYLDSGNATPFGDFPEEHRPYVKAAAAWLWDFDPQPIAVERLVCDPILGYAGTLDLRATIQGRVAVVDFKTSEAGAIYPQAHIQAAAYVLADEICGAGSVADTLLVAFGGDGEYHVTKAAPVGFAAWLSAVHFYKDLRKLEAAVRKGDE